MQILNAIMVALSITLIAVDPSSVHVEPDCRIRVVSQHGTQAKFWHVANCAKASENVQECRLRESLQSPESRANTTIATDFWWLRDWRSLVLFYAVNKSRMLPNTTKALLQAAT